MLDAGYLTTGAPDDPVAAAGGAALLDLAAALSWLRRNVAAFGGDPRRVTLAGHAAGAGLANALLMTPHAKGTYRCSICNHICKLRHVFKRVKYL